MPFQIIIAENFDLESRFLCSFSRFVCLLGPLDLLLKVLRFLWGLFESFGCRSQWVERWRGAVHGPDGVRTDHLMTRPPKATVRVLVGLSVRCFNGRRPPETSGGHGWTARSRIKTAPSFVFRQFIRSKMSLLISTRIRKWFWICSSSSFMPFAVARGGCFELSEIKTPSFEFSPFPIFLTSEDSSPKCLGSKFGTSTLVSTWDASRPLGQLKALLLSWS